MSDLIGTIRDVSTGDRVAGAYTANSNTRNRIPGTNFTDDAVSCTGFRGVGRYRAIAAMPVAPISLKPWPESIRYVSTGHRVARA
eukprot:1010021-Rhodomonas_salina.3